MWISREHFNLIRDRSAEFRQWHEERMRDRNEVIRGLDARLAESEQERRRLTELFVRREEERLKPPAPEAAPGPVEGWEAMMRKEIEEMNAPAEQ
jgi:hypothetical protein